MILAIMARIMVWCVVLPAHLRVCMWSQVRVYFHMLGSSD